VIVRGGHFARHSPVSVGAGQRAVSMARDKIILTMEERTRNIWMTEIEGRYADAGKDANTKGNKAVRAFTLRTILGLAG
jgi:hypothetical protein